MEVLLLIMVFHIWMKLLKKNWTNLDRVWFLRTQTDVVSGRGEQQRRTKDGLIFWGAGG